MGEAVRGRNGRDGEGGGGGEEEGRGSAGGSVPMPGRVEVEEGDDLRDPVLQGEAGTGESEGRGMVVIG